MHRVKKIIRSALSLQGIVLEQLGYRKSIFLLETGNWFGLPWNELFRKDRALLLRYSLKRFSHGDVYEAGHDVEIFVSAETYTQTSYAGFNLWEITKVGILASLESPMISDSVSERELKVIQFYYTKAARTLEGARCLLKKTRPIAVVTVQGCNPMSRPLLEVAREMGIRNVGVEGSFLGDYFFCDSATGMIVNRHRAACLDGYWLDTRSYTAEQQQKFRDELQEARKNKRAEHATGSEEPTNVRKLLKVDPEKKIAIFIGQVLTDAAMIMDSKIFPDPASLIEQVIAYFQRKPDWFLVVKLHPKEDGGASWINNPDEGFGYGTPPNEPKGPLPYNCLTYETLMSRGVAGQSPTHVILKDKQISTDAIVKEASFGITVTSQAGFEFLLNYKPLVVCGDAFFARKGFTMDVAHPNALSSTLDAATTNDHLDDEQILKIDQFGDHMLQSVLFRKDLGGSRERLLYCITGDRKRWMRSKRDTELN